jgi:hypothetical protein
VDKADILKILDQIDLDQTEFDFGQDVMIIDGKPIGRTAGRADFGIKLWWDELKLELAEFLEPRIKRVIRKKGL